MDDAREREVFGGLNSAGNEDEDLDGVSNVDELAMGTDPLRPESVLHLEIQLVGQDHWKASWASIPGKRYRVAVSEEANGPWRTLNPVVTAVATHTELLLPDLNGGQTTFVELLVSE
jgi:hypothetical protein